ncbi:hypothetical protein BD414DRAFT_287538 [Trametes punicea]|nr:hypothetical protein BD414DRAFT_287538 [Trametes punicea]
MGQRQIRLHILLPLPYLRVFASTSHGDASAFTHSSDKLRSPWSCDAAEAGRAISCRRRYTKPTQRVSNPVLSRPNIDTSSTNALALHTPSLSGRGSCLRRSLAAACAAPTRADRWES